MEAETNVRELVCYLPRPGYLQAFPEGANGGFWNWLLKLLFLPVVWPLPLLYPASHWADIRDTYTRHRLQAMCQARSRDRTLSKPMKLTTRVYGNRTILLCG